MTTRALAAFLLLVVLVAYPVIAALPDQIGNIRLAGLSVLWWCGGVIAPVLAALIALAWLPDRSPSRSE